MDNFIEKSGYFDRNNINIFDNFIENREKIIDVLIEKIKESRYFERKSIF